MSTPALVGCIPPAQYRPGSLLLTPEHIQLSRPCSLIEAAVWSLLLPVPLPTHADQRGYQSSFCFQDPPSCDPGLRPQLARQNTWEETEGPPGPDPSPGFSQTGRELPIVGVGVIWGGVHCTTTQGGRGGWAGDDEGGMALGWEPCCWKRAEDLSRSARHFWGTEAPGRSTS